MADRAPVPVELEFAPEDRLPGPVEAAAYYVVSEALTNVAKYAGASIVRSRRPPGGAALIEVADDGAGGADPSGGSGLRGLADRVEALGGHLRSRARSARAPPSAPSFQSGGLAGAQTYGNPPT